MDVNQELKFFWKIQKKMGGGGGWVHGGGGGGPGWGVRMDVNKIEVYFFFLGGGSGGGRVGGVRVDVNEELKFL